MFKSFFGSKQKTKEKNDTPLPAAPETKKEDPKELKIEHNPQVAGILFNGNLQPPENNSRIQKGQYIIKRRSMGSLLGKVLQREGEDEFEGENNKTPEILFSENLPPAGNDKPVHPGLSRRLQVISLSEKSEKIEISEKPEFSEKSEIPGIPNMVEKELEKIEVGLQEKEKKKIGFDEFPEHIQKKVLALKITPEQIEENINELRRICHFLYGSEFLGEKPVEKKSKPYLPYASQHIVEKGKLEIKEHKTLKKQYKLGILSGQGGFGSVFMAKDKLRKVPVAVKKVSMVTEKMRVHTWCEIGFISQCSHPNIATYYNAWLHKYTKKDSEEVWMIFEYLHGGTLAQGARSFRFEDRHIAFFAREILKGVQYLHGRRWLHRDLKSSNVMLDISGKVKIIDFGLCCDLESGPKMSIVGSPYWIPPEMIKGIPYGCPADIWSFAVCILELYLQEPPHYKSNLKCMFAAVTEGLIKLIPKSASSDARDFLEKCLIQDPSKRPLCDELLEHPWLNQKGIDDGVLDIFKMIFLNNTMSVIL